jgi:lipid-A-disaccharide synthase
VPVTYVGHPLADMIPMKPDRREARKFLRLPLAQPIVALLPGSRKAELHYMADLFVKTAKTLIGEVPDAHFVAPDGLARDVRHVQTWRCGATPRSTCR